MTTCPYCEKSTNKGDLALGPQSVLGKYTDIHKHCLELSIQTKPELMAILTTKNRFDQINPETFLYWRELIKEASLA